MGSGKVVIVGAGPCGLACARELAQLQHPDFAVLEAADGPGGLAASTVDAAGFTWDRGGHVVFSHYGEFDRLVADLMAGDVEHHERSSYVHVAGCWVPYPFQNNLHRLPPALAEEALVGLVNAAVRHSGAVARDDFETWMRSMFGDGICNVFMRPYNEKVWAHPPAVMSSSWIGDRVSVVDWQHALRAVVHREDDVGWGPNNLFSFPRSGGTGEIYRRAAMAVADRITYRNCVRAVDAERKVVVTAGGAEVPYEQLVWTGPLDALVAALMTVPPAVARAARDLVHSSVTVVGIGYAEPVTDDRSWLYFPDPDVPFYRATNFAKYAAANVPDARTDRYCSWMTEIASSAWRPLCGDDLAARVDHAIRDVGLVGPDAKVASVHVDHIPYGYPVPTLGRDAALAVIQPWLMERDVFSRGRFGAWLYELGNMDHAVKMGVDVARLIVEGQPEQAWRL